MLKLVDVACIRGQGLLFRNLSRSINCGSLLRVHGANGVGKTSLLRIIVGLSSPHTGQVIWKQQPISQDMDYFRTQLLFIGHSDALKPDLTPHENISFLLALGKIRVDEDQLSQDISRWGLGRLKGKPVYSLSKGQRRRLSLMRLLYGHNKPLWVLDEPFIGLDPKAISVLVALIESHLARKGIVIYTTHQNVDIKSPINKIIRLDQI